MDQFLLPVSFYYLISFYYKKTSVVQFIDNCKDTLKKSRIKNLNRVIISETNMSYMRNKIRLLSEGVLGKIDIFIVSETKIKMSFRTSRFVIHGFVALFRLNRTNTGGGILD